MNKYPLGMCQACGKNHAITLWGYICDLCVECLKKLTDTESN